MSTPPRDPVRTWIRTLSLRPHPEGGWYREIWRSDRRVRADDGDRQDRSAGTSIHYLLDERRGSRFHRIRCDEIWVLVDGGPLDVHVLGAEGAVSVRRLSARPVAGMEPQTVVPAGAWFAAEVVPGARYALAACVVAPGFEFADLEFADRADLLASHPAATGAILRLTAGPRSSLD